MSRHGSLAHVRGIQPDIVVAAVMMEKAAMIAEVAFQFRTFHAVSLR
jgi:hypothetical protein